MLKVGLGIGDGGADDIVAVACVVGVVRGVGCGWCLRLVLLSSCVRVLCVLSCVVWLVGVVGDVCTVGIVGVVVGAGLVGVAGVAGVAGCGCGVVCGWR